MIAITAGIVTTRVSSERKDTHFGKEISEQLLGQPKALMIAAGVVFSWDWIPGFPGLSFFMLLAHVGKPLAISSAQYQTERLQKRSRHGFAPWIPMCQAMPWPAEAPADDYALTLPVVLEVGSAHLPKIRKDKQGMTFIDQMIPKMRHALYQDLGVRFPGVHVRTDSPTFGHPMNTRSISMKCRLLRGKIILKHSLLTNETEETLRRYNIPFISLRKVSLGMPALWVDEKYQEILQRAGIRFWTGLEVMILHLSKFYRQYASEFIGIQEVRAILEFVEKSFPDLIKEVTRLVPLQKLTEILRRLVQEQVSIKDLRTILEALSEWAQTEKDTVLLTEYVRSSLKRYISYKYSLGQTVLSVYLARSGNRRYGPRRHQTNLCRLLSRARSRFRAADPPFDAQHHCPTPPGRPTAGSSHRHRRAPIRPQTHRRRIPRNTGHLLSRNRSGNPDPTSGPGPTDMSHDPISLGKLDSVRAQQAQAMRSAA